jgi:hypothetical protein
MPGSLYQQKTNNMIKKTKHTLLLGEGVHQHTLYGKFAIGDGTDFAELEVTEESLLKHEHPNGNFGEHQTLKIEKGDWVMGRQVEFNPMDSKITRVWD